MTHRRIRSEPQQEIDLELATIWPFLLVAPTLLLIRYSGIPRQIGIWLWVGVLLVMVIQILRHRRALREDRTILILGTLVFLLGISLVWSPETTRGLRFFGMLGTGAVAMLWGRVTGPPKETRAIFVVGISGLVLTALALFIVSEPPPIDGLNPDRILAMGALALMIAAWHGPQTRWRVLAVGLATLIVIVLSGSRTASLVAFVLLITAPGLKLRWPIRSIVALLGVGMVVVVSIAAGLNLPGTHSDGDSLIEIGSSGRFEVWSDLAADCGTTLFGHGAGASDDLAVASNPAFSEPHNEYLRLWCDTGLLGLTLFLAMIASASLGAVRSIMKRTTPPWAGYTALQMMLVVLMLSLTDNPLTTTVPLMVPAALAIGWSLRVTAESDTMEAASGSGARGRHLI